MSRVLAQLAGKDEPRFYQWLKAVEQSAGLPRVDILLSLQIAADARAKITELGLDPTDTTGHELYSALQARLRQDESNIEQALGLSNGASSQDVLTAVVNFMQTKEQASDVLAIKSPVVKRILKKLKLKNTMKALGYRSMDSMLKHESVAQLLAAADMLEPQEWHQKRLAEYKKLSSGDFETRPVQFVLPTSKKWPQIASNYTQKYRHNVLAIHEVGSVIVLPLDIELPALAITTVAVCVHALNDIRASSAYLKLQQVRPDFGEVVAAMVYDEWSQIANIHGADVSWGTLHWFYGSRHNTETHPELFEPHVQPEDMQLHEVEILLSQLDSSFSFWQGTHFLGILDSENKAVSMNVLDVALSVCNALNYPERIAHSMQAMLDRELIGRYLSNQAIHAQVSTTLGTQLVPEFSFD